MKRITLIATLILATIAIISCSKGSGNESFGKNKLLTTIQVDASVDLIAASDIEITYWDKGGVKVADTITSIYWKKRILNDSFPTVIGLPEYRLLLKPNAKFDRDRCQLKLRIAYFDKILSWGSEPVSIDDIASSKVLDYLKINESAMGVSKQSEDRNVLKVYIKDGKFEYDNIFDLEQSQEPSKKTEK